MDDVGNEDVDLVGVASASEGSPDPRLAGPGRILGDSIDRTPVETIRLGQGNKQNILDRN